MTCKQLKYCQEIPFHSPDFCYTTGTTVYENVSVAANVTNLLWYSGEIYVQSAQYVNKFKQIHLRTVLNSTAWCSDHEGLYKLEFNSDEQIT
jgi:hypothetical protein